METGGPPAVVVKKVPLTPKAIIHKMFGEKACYKVEEVHEPTHNGCPGLALPQKGPSLYRCCLQLPEFSVVSETFKRKKDAEQSAAEMALEKLGINPAADPAAQDPWDALVGRLSYLFSNEFLSSLHPLSCHFRAALQRVGHLSCLVPISVLAVYDAKLSSLCKTINPKVESDPLLIMPLVLKAAQRSGSVSTHEDQLSLRRRNPYPPEIMQTLVNQQSSLAGSIWISAILIPCSVEKTAISLMLKIALNDYYPDVIAQKLGLSDASTVLVSRTVGKASSEMRLYFCAPKSCLGDLSSGLLDSTESVYPKGSLNKRGSYLSGQLVYGDAILASIGYKWKSSDLVYEDVSLRTYYRLLLSKTPCGLYKLSRDAVLAAELPGAFTSRTNWRGSFPRDLLCTFCRQHRLSEPVFSIVSNPLESLTEFPGSQKKLKVTESGNQVINKGANDSSGSVPIGSRETFSCEVKIFSRCQDLIIECSPKQSFKKQNDAFQNASLRVLSWLNKYFKKLDMDLEEKLDMDLEELTSCGDILDIQFDSQLFIKEFSLAVSVYTHWQSIGVQAEDRVLDPACVNQLGDTVGSIDIKGPDSGVSPSNGSLVSVVYSICLVTGGEHGKELIESTEDFEFEIGSGSVISCLESVVTQMSVGQSARFYMKSPPQDLILASARDSSLIVPVLTPETPYCTRQPPQPTSAQSLISSDHCLSSPTTVIRVATTDDLRSAISDCRRSPLSSSDHQRESLLLLLPLSALSASPVTGDLSLHRKNFWVRVLRGKTRARDAALNAIQSPLLDIGIERATGIVWNITGGSDLSLLEVNAAAEIINDLVDPSANLIFGAVIDPHLSGQISITLIATGFKRQEESDGRSLQATQLRQGDVTVGINRRPSSSNEGGSVEIPEFLRKKGLSRFPRA